MLGVKNMDKLKLFFIGFFGFLLWDLLFEFLKGLANDAVLSNWGFVAIIVSVFGIMWAVASLAVCVAKRKGTVTESLSGFLYFMILVSLFAAFDMIRYFLENDMLNFWYFFTVGFALVFFGWAGGRMDSWLPKKQNKKIKRG